KCAEEFLEKALDSPVSSVISVVQDCDLLCVLCVSAVKRSSVPGTAPQRQTCTESRKPRETQPGACARAFHPAPESAQPTLANTHTDLALPKSLSRPLEELS